MIQTDVLNCGSGSVGTWYDGCKVVPKDFTKAFLMAPSASIDLTSGTLDETVIAGLIKKGLLVPLNDTLQIAEAGAKSNIQTLPNKREIYISSGLYKFTIDFEANVCLVKSMHRLAKKKWQLLLLDSEGKLFFDNKAGQLNGFEIQSLIVDNEAVNDGGSKFAMFTVSIQLTPDGTKGYNERRSFILSDDFDFSIVNGIQDVKLASLTLTAANFTLSVLAGCDGSTPILGLATANFKVIKATDGSTVAATVTDQGNGVYKLANVALIAGSYVVQLYDSVLGYPVADILEEAFYQSNALPVVLT